MAEWVRIHGHWKQRQTLCHGVDDGDEWFQQMLRDSQEIEEHVDRVTNVPIETGNIELCIELCDQGDIDDDVAEDICNISSSSEVVVGDHLLHSRGGVYEQRSPSMVEPIQRDAPIDTGSTSDVSNPTITYLQKLEDQHKNLRKQMDDMRERLEVTEIYLGEQHEYIELLEKRINHLDQYGRRQNIEISGIPNVVSDNVLEEEVIKILKKIGLKHIVSYNIIGCHRLRTKDRLGNKNVIVRFVNRKDAVSSLKARYKLHSCTEPDYRKLRIFENLCPTYRSIYDSLNEEKRKGNIKELWTYNGVINYKLTGSDNERPNKIHVENDFCMLKRKWGVD